jgi:hypothetical protein
LELSRRRFLSAVAAVAPMGRAFPAPTRDEAHPCAGCVLPESREGYRKALAGRDQGSLVVFPATPGFPPSLPARVRNGQWVIFESAAGFAETERFEEQRAGLRAAFGLALEEPVAPWRQGPRPPYVDLEWPSHALVRDFSSVITVGGGQAIGRMQGRPVAALSRAGAGVLIFLGSPIGPALWSDDTGAHAWLSTVLARAKRDRV